MENALRLTSQAQSLVEKWLQTVLPMAQGRGIMVIIRHQIVSRIKITFNSSCHHILIPTLNFIV